VFPLVFAFFVGTAPEGVAVMTDISQYLDFVLTLFFAFGVAFEVPIATIVLVWMGVTSPADLARKRPYVIVGAFVIGMLLTPPDVISQTLLALPMWVLFELGIQASKFFVREPDGAEDGPPEPSDPGPGNPGPEPASPGGGPSASRASSSLVGADIAGGDPFDTDRFVPMTGAEMEAELDAIEAEEGPGAADGKPGNGADPVEAKLRRVQSLREREDQDGARRLLYEVLAEGDADQRAVARNILAQLDAP
jgi:sec-independent protein translocase protein TatC